MGNSPCSGQGGSEAYDSRDVERDEFKDGRPNEITKLAAAETKTNIDEPSNSNSPQWRPNAGPKIFVHKE